MAKEGAKIILYGDLPENVSGFAHLEAKNAAFERFKAGINFSQTNNPGVVKATYGNGSIYTGKDLDQLLAFAGIKREQMADSKISFTRRENKTGFAYFIVNRGEKAFDGWLPLTVNASAAAIFNPMTEKSGLAEGRPGKNGQYETYLRIFPGEGLIISAYNTPVTGNPYPFYDVASTPNEITGSWKVDFIDGGEALPPAHETEKLTSWTDFGGDAVKDFSGTAKYSITFARPSGKADAWMLDLGKVFESVRINLNGAEVGVLIGPEFRITLDKKQVKKKNTLEIKVSNLMANRIAYMDRNNIEWKKFYNVNMAARMRQNTKNGIFDASAWEPRESGLLGPVTITPLTLVK
jgi:hypothetical protein